MMNNTQKSDNEQRVRREENVEIHPPKAKEVFKGEGSDWCPVLLTALQGEE